MSRLLNKAEARQFKKIIDNYQPNNEVLQQFKESNFAVIAGPAGAGKDTLREELIKRYPKLYLPILSTTTRPPRAAETNGQTYHFWEVEAVKNDLDEREFFQAALVHNQQVSCLHVDEVRKLKPGQWGISILIPTTEEGLRLLKPNIKTIFLIAPTLGSLIERMQSERLLDDAEISRRLEAAKNEISYALGAEHYYCLISDTVEHVAQKAHAFLKAGVLDEAADAKAGQTMRQIMLELSHER